jgi:uncharacterized protein (TIGR03437 family)
MTRFLALALLTAAILPAAPTIAKGGIYNSAGYARDGAMNRGIAPGSVFVVFGSGLGPTTLAQVQSYPLQKDLAGVTVKVSVEFGPTFDAYPLYVSAGQIGVMLPSATPAGRSNVTVTYQGQTSAPESITVVKRNVGVYAINQTGSGPAVVQNFVSATEQPLNTLVTPAQPGQTVILWGTGLGAIPGDEISGPAPGDIAAFVSIYVGGVRVTPRYTGRSGCCAGIDQIVFDVPRTVQGCYVPVQVVGSGLLSTRENATIPTEHTVSNTVTMSVAQTGPCTDPTGLTGPELAALAAKGSARVGAFSFTRRPNGLDESTTDSAAGRVSRFDAATFLQSRGIFGLPSPGSCVQYQVNTSELAGADPIAAPPLDAGAALTVTGPGGSRQLSKDATGNYSAALGSSFLTAGSYQLSASGGADVASFDASFTMPSAPSWTNKNPEAYAQSFSPDFRWTLAGPADYVAAYAYGRNDLTAFYTVCIADPVAGSLTIPSYAYAGLVLHTSSAPGVIWIGAGSVSRLNISGLDFGLVHAVAGTSGVFIP